MTPPLPDIKFSDWDDETFERALDRATRGSDRSSLDEPIEDLELVAAAVHLAALDPLEAPPASVMERLRSQAQQAFPRREADGAGPGLRALPSTQRADAPAGGDGAFGGSPSSRFTAWTGWLVAAGILTVLLLRGGAGSDPRLERENLLAAADAVVLDWSATDDPYAGSVSGDLVWSTAKQSGFMRFRDLAENDPSEIQYQLWIFDGSRPDSPPIDGGVFDVASGGGAEVIVPIDAKLPVGTPTLFAVTVEQPGGVVVSAKEHIIVVAEPAKG